MRTALARRAGLVALTVLVALVSVAPAAADERVQKLEPRGQLTYRPGRSMTPDTDILSVSGYAAWMIDEALASTTPLPHLGAAFLRAERKEGINARYLVSHALLESGWGTSDIARFKHNLFGYNAYDRGPWQNASSFRTYQAGIAAIAAKIKDSYLTPTGRWWYGYTTLRAVNRYYASDPRWADKIAVIANQLDAQIVTLKERRLRFASPSLAARPVAGSRLGVVVPWTARSGAVLPDGIRFAARWVPLAVVENGATGPRKAPTSRWTLVSRRDRGRTARLGVRVPSTPGLYRLELQARDSDGRQLPKSDRPGIRSLVVRVAGAREADASLALRTDGRLEGTITNIGTRPILASRAGTPTTIEAWALPLDPEVDAFRLAAVPLDGPLAPGRSRTIRFARPAVPAVVLLRLDGDAAAVGRARPVAALAARAKSGRVTLTALEVESPRDDALLDRKATRERVALVPLDAVGSVRVLASAAAAATTGNAVAAAEGAPGRFSVLVRSLAAEPARAAAPSVALRPLPGEPPSPASVEISGLPSGIRLVMAALVPPDGGPADARTIRLAWLPVTEVGEAAPAHE